ASGAPGWWDWENADKTEVYDRYRSVGEFVRQSGLLSKRGLTQAPVSIETATRGSLVLTPGQGWTTARQTDFTILPSGSVAGLGQMPSYLQGSAHKAMFPSATLKADFPAAGTVKVLFDKVSKNGAHVALAVDGGKPEEKDAPAAKEEKPVSLE